METVTLPVYNTEGKLIESLKPDKTVFDGTINTAAIYQAVNAYRTNQRKGLASTKTRKEVSGGGRKPWRQKGTGRARAGSIRSPLWRHGGVIFGPHPKDYYYKLPRRIKNLALKSSLNVKAKENNIIVLDQVNLEKPKTKEASEIFFNLKVNPVKNIEVPKGKGKHTFENKSKNKRQCRVLLLLEKLDDNLKMAFRNIEFLSINLARDTHAYEVMRHRKLVITKEGLKDLINRLRPLGTSVVAEEKL